MSSRVLHLAVALAAALGCTGVAAALHTPTQDSDPPQSAEGRCLPRHPEICLPEPVSEEEPHRGNCAWCHDLWSPDPGTTIRSCTGGGCHSGMAESPVFHRTLWPEVLAECVHCHEDHTFRVPMSADDCTACHSAGGRTLEWVDITASRALTAPSIFAHADHGLVDCGQCHGTSEAHGTLKLASQEDCRTCHHLSKEADDCTRCHAGASLAGEPFLVVRSLDIRIGTLDRPLRLLPFDHAKHEDFSCRGCHTLGPDLRVAQDADCSTCHLEHHSPSSNCVTCHEPPGTSVHTPDAHLGCGGVGCHDPVPEGVRQVPRTRQLCLACHTQKEAHKPAKNCVDCHRLPAARVQPPE